MEVLELAGIGEIKVRRSANIKYLRIRMAPGRGVWVSVPFGVSRKQVEKFLEENREWILKNRKDMKVYEEDTGVGLGIGAEIKTKLHVLRIVETEEPKPSYRLEQEKITLFIPKKVDFSKVEKIVQQFLLEIYTMECRRYLPQRTINVDWYTSTKIQTLYQIALVKSFVVFAEFVPRNTAERTNRIPVYFFM